MFSRVAKLARGWAEGPSPFTNVYGFARTLLAVSTALTLIFSDAATLFRPGAGLPGAPICSDARALGLFCQVPASRLDLARIFAVAALLVVASGWRPRLTGLLHAWLTWSLQANALVLDGGDSVASILALLLVPMTLADGRRWHWERPSSDAGEIERVVARVALTAVRVQVAGIYFHAAVAKFAVEEWSNGTILYYVFTNPAFGVTGWRRDLLWPILMNGTALTLLTWSILALEYFLSAGLVMPKRYRGPLLVAGIVFHGGIILVHGLWSFAMAMFAALILFLRSPEQELDFRWLGRLASRRALGRALQVTPPEEYAGAGGRL